MYLSNQSPLLFCDSDSLRIENFCFDRLTTEILIKPLALFCDKNHFYKTTTVLAELFQATLLAGFISKNDLDYVFFAGQASFLPNLEGIGRINIGNIVKRADKICMTDWKFKAKKFLLTNFSLYSATPICPQDFLSLPFIGPGDWKKLLDSKVDFDEFMVRFSEITSVGMEKIKKQKNLN